MTPEEKLKSKKFDSSHLANCCSCEPIGNERESYAVNLSDAIEILNEALRLQREIIKTIVKAAMDNTANDANKLKEDYESDKIKIDYQEHKFRQNGLASCYHGLGIALNAILNAPLPEME